MKNYNSVATLSFVVIHESKQKPTKKELSIALKRKLYLIEKELDNIEEMVEISDTYFMEEPFCSDTNEVFKEYSI